MIVFDLKCGQAHVFEAWFGSSADYEDQRGRGLIECPFCGDKAIGKAVMAPRLGSKVVEDAPAPVASAPTPPPEMKALMAAMAHRTVHGEATPAEAKALAEEGVSVMPLPFPVIPPEQRN
jgi:hypothetical protein